MKLTIEAIRSGEPVDLRTVPIADLLDLAEIAGVYVDEQDTKTGIMKKIKESVGLSKPDTGVAEPEDTGNAVEHAEPEPQKPMDLKDGFLERRREQIEAAKAQNLDGGTHVDPMAYGPNAPEYIKRRMKKD